MTLHASPTSRSLHNNVVTILENLTSNVCQMIGWSSNPHDCIFSVIRLVLVLLVLCQVLKQLLSRAKFLRLLIKRKNFWELSIWNRVEITECAKMSGIKAKMLRWLNQSKYSNTPIYREIWGKKKAQYFSGNSKLWSTSHQLKQRTSTTNKGRRKEHSKFAEKGKLGWNCILM